MRKPVNGIYEQQRCRSACTSAQSGQCLCCSLPTQYILVHQTRFSTIFTSTDKSYLTYLLHIKVRLPVLLCAVKSVEGDFRFCWMISPNVGQTHKENPNLVRFFIWHLHWIIYTNSTTNYTNIDKQKSVHFAVPRSETRLKNASDLYMKYRSYAEHCRPCTRLSGENWWKK